MASAAVGAVAIADVGRSNPATGQRSYDIKGALSNPVTWSWIWFGVSVAVIGGLYFGFGGYKGDVAS